MAKTKTTSHPPAASSHKMSTRSRARTAAAPKGVLKKNPGAARGRVKFSTRYALSAKDVEGLLEAKNADEDPEDALWIFSEGIFEKIQGDDECPPGRVEVVVKVPRGFGWLEWPGEMKGVEAEEDEEEEVEKVAEEVVVEEEVVEEAEE